MNDILRKGVELLGWTVDDDGWAYDLPATMPKQVHISWQWFEDHVAAQLVRQVDALRDREVEGEFFHTEPAFGSLSIGAAVVYLPDPFEVEPIIVSGPDRTMNTIRAIVESGVLNEQ